MIDINKQVAYWRAGAEDAWEAAKGVVGYGQIRLGLVLAHWALEKILKAHVCRQTQDLAPATDDLIALAKLGAVVVTAEQRDLLARMNQLGHEGLYPDPDAPPVSPSEGQRAITGCEEAFRSLLSEL